MNAKFKTATSVFFVHVAKDASANVQKLFVIHPLSKYSVP